MHAVPCLFLFLALPLVLQGQPLVQEKIALQLQDTYFELNAVAHSSQQATEAVEAGIMEIMRVQGLVSEQIQASEVSEINRSAGLKPVTVSPELFALLQHCRQVSGLTSGAFDITSGMAESLWTSAAGSGQIPASEQVSARVAQMGYEKIKLDSGARTVFIPAGTQINLAEAQVGYTIARAKAVMQGLGVAGGAVCGGSTVVAWGRQATGSHWYVGVPGADEAETDNALSWLVADETTVATIRNTGTWANESKNQFSGIIDPRTGYPVSGVVSVSIICPNAQLAATLARAVMVLGPHQGLFLVNQLPNVACLLFTDKNELMLSENMNMQQHGKATPETTKAVNLPKN